MGGLHEFMQWPHPMLTDSGGFQVFSLSDTRKVDEEGVTFKSHIDGSTHRFTPESSIQVQEKLGADIIMAFDECAAPHDLEYNQRAVVRTHNWLKRCVDAKTRTDQALFGIVQGGVFADLRRQSAEFVTSMELPGTAIGGLSVGESKAEMHAMLDVLHPLLPADKPRYLMGVGSPRRPGQRCAARGGYLRLCAANPPGPPSIRLHSQWSYQPDECRFCPGPQPHR
jgi:queuine tRNA-ribosyltransferase